MNLRRLMERFVGRDASSIELTKKLEAREADPAVVTIVSVVFSTAPQSFSGPAVFVTMTGTRTQTAIRGATTNAADDDDDDSASTTARAGSSVRSSSRPSTTPLASSLASSATAATAASAAVSATSSADAAAAASDGGMSGGAKAGLAFGILALIGLLFAAVFFFYKKRKQNKDDHVQLDDEKAFLSSGRNPDALPSHASPSARNGTSPTTPFGARSTEKIAYPAPVAAPAAAPVAGSSRQRFSYEEAPQLNVRAVSQFNPGFPNEPPTAHPMPSNAANTAAGLTIGAAAVTAAGAAATANKNLSVKDADPFGNHAERRNEPGTNPRNSSLFGVQAADFPLPESTPGTPVVAKSPGFHTPMNEPATKEPETAVAGAAAGAAAIAAATAAAASNKPQGAAPVPGPSPDNVHRVQLDFKPSMEDELEIHAGQLIRVLHEYDDGWALCIRMDRSAQGVVPRTCLSKHPVKPRPQSPRPGPNGPMRGPGAPPFAQSPRPHSPGGGRNSPGLRNMSPAPHSQAPRPLTPNDGRGRGNSNPAPFANPQSGPASPATNGGSKLRTQETASPSRIPGPAGQPSTRKPVGGQ